MLPSAKLRLSITVFIDVALLFAADTDRSAPMAITMIIMKIAVETRISISVKPCGFLYIVNSRVAGDLPHIQ